MALDDNIVDYDKVTEIGEFVDIDNSGCAKCSFFTYRIENRSGEFWIPNATEDDYAEFIRRCILSYAIEVAT